MERSDFVVGYGEIVINLDEYERSDRVQLSE